MKTTTVALALILSLAAAVQAAPSVQLTLRLHDSQGQAFTYQTAVDGSRYAGGMTPSVGDLAQHLTAAKQKMADELGYTAKLYGRDHYKVLGAVRVAGAWIEQYGRREALGSFRGIQQQGESERGE